MKLYHQGDYTVRKFLPKEWKAFRAIRLEAVKREPNIFVRGLDEELLTEKAEWVERLKDTHRAYFGLFYHDDCIGMSAVALHSEDASTGILAVSYIDAAHRGKGLSHLFYNARIDWALRRNLRKLVVSHRKDNDASRAAIQKFYFQPTHRELKEWPDGKREEQLFYELDLQKWRNVFVE